MKESIFYGCFLVIIIVVSIVGFFFLPKLSYIQTVRLEKEFHGYANKISFYNEAVARAYEVMRTMPVDRLEYEGAIPVKAYLTDGSIKDIKWGN